jgi:hypothetical protein
VNCTRPRLSWLWLLAVLLLASGCTGRYFRPAGAPPAQPPRYALDELRWHEYWTGIIFNGDKIGFSHLAVRPVPDEPGRYRIDSEASLVIRLLGFSKKIQLRAEDVVNADLTLVRFDYDYNIDGNTLRISGTQEDGKPAPRSTTPGAVRSRCSPRAARFAASAINLHPVIHGLKIGAQYRFEVYSGETQSLLEVRQSIEGFEASELFPGAAYKVQTSASGHGATTWIDESGKPVFELALYGVLISALEGESEARRYLALAAVNKRDTLIDFSLVKPDRPIPDPRHTTRMRVVITGAPAAPATTDTQRCEPQGNQWLCDIAASAGTASALASEPGGYLQPSITVPSGTQPIRDLSHEIAGDAPHPRRRSSACSIGSART